MPKRRGAGEGGLYFIESKNLWTGVVDVGFWPDGRRRQKWVYGKTKTIARDKLRALQDEIAKHGTPIGTTYTVARWAEHWLETVCVPTMKPAGLRSYTAAVHKWIIPTLGKKKLAQLRPTDLRHLYQVVGAAGNTSMPAKVHTVMASMLEAARLDGAVHANVARDVTPPRTPEVQRDALSTVDALAVLRVAAQRVDGTRWWVALLAAMRQGERIGATLDSIDFDNHVFHVTWSLTRGKFQHGCGDPVDGTWPCGKKVAGFCSDRRMVLAPNMVHRSLGDSLYVLTRPKSGKARTFPLIPQLEAALARYLEATKDVPNPHGLIWRRADGSPIPDYEDQAEWRQILHLAGLITEEQTLEPRKRPEGTPDAPTTHWARHTTVSVLIALGVPAAVIGEIVGHSSERITARYTHVSSPMAQAAMEAIGGHFAQALEA